MKKEELFTILSGSIEFGWDSNAVATIMIKLAMKKYFKNPYSVRFVSGNLEIESVSKGLFMGSVNDYVLYAELMATNSFGAYERGYYRIWAGAGEIKIDQSRVYSIRTNGNMLNADIINENIHK